MPLRLGKDCIAGQIKCDNVHCAELGSHSNPVKTVHRHDNAEEIFEHELSFVERSSNTTRCAIRASGHFAISKTLELYDGDLRTGVKRWSVGITDRGNFCIKDEASNLPVLPVIVAVGWQ